jgi:hypothetical protein
MHLKNYLPLPLWPSLCGCLLGIVWQTKSLIQNPIILGLILLINLPLLLLTYTQKQGDLIKIQAVFFSFLVSALIASTPGYFFKKIYQKVGDQIISISGQVHTIKKSHPQKTVVLNNISLTCSGKTIHPPWFTQARLNGFFPHKLLIGDKITLTNTVLKKPTADVLPFLYKEHCIGFFFATNKNLLWLRQKASLSTEAKQRINRAAAENLSPQAQSLVKSVFLGQGEFLPSKTRDLFERWGISHFLARSGIHLIVFAAVLLWLLQYCLVPVRFSRTASAIVVVLYHIISSPSISFLRAFSMNMLLAVAIIFGESAQLLHLFSIITLTVLYVNPFFAYGLDFQLSFGISGALIFIFTIMQSIDK